MTMTAPQRLRRVLAMIPWIASHDDGAPIPEICARFGVTRAQLTADLNVIYLVGRYPFTPDELIEVQLFDDRVHLRFAEVFRRPLRLTAEEGLSLLAAGAGLLASPGESGEDTVALRGALQKLAVTLGVDLETVVDVRLGDATDAVMRTLRTALREARQVRLDHYSNARDARLERVVDPWALWARDGHWYLSGYCHRAEDERVFRVDRIVEAHLLASPAEVQPEQGEPFEAALVSGDLPTVLIDLPPEQAWIVGTIPTSSVEASGDHLRVRVPVAGRAWLERLLLQLGPGATVVAQGEEPGDVDVRAEAARRILARYDAFAVGEVQG